MRMQNITTRLRAAGVLAVGLVGFGLIGGIAGVIRRFHRRDASPVVRS